MRGSVSIGLLVMCLGLGGVGVDAVVEQSGNGEAARSASQEVQTDERVELNSADRAALEALPGVGPRTAQLIIEYREEHGRFEKVEELMNVRGIGERTFLRLRELVRVNATTSR